MDERQHSLHLSMVTCCVAIFITATATHHWIGSRRATLIMMIMRRATHHWIGSRRATLIMMIMRRATHHWIGSSGAAAIRTAHQRLDTARELVFALLTVGWWRIRGATLWIQSLADVAIRKLGLTLMDERKHSLHLSMVTCCVAVFITATALRALAGAIRPRVLTLSTFTDAGALITDALQAMVVRVPTVTAADAKTECAICLLTAMTVVALLLMLMVTLGTGMALLLMGIGCSLARRATNIAARSVTRARLRVLAGSGAAH